MSGIIIRILLFSVALTIIAAQPLYAEINGKESTVVQALSTTTPTEQKKENTPSETPEQVRKREMIEKYGVEIANAILVKKVLKEMTKNQVLLARGAPTRKEIIPPDAELWHYTFGEVAFENGKVTYIDFSSETETLPTSHSNEGVRQQAAIYNNSGNNPSSLATTPSVKVGDSYIYESTDSDHPTSSVMTKRTVISNGDRIVFSTINLNSKTAKTRNLYFNNEWNLLNTRNADNGGFDYSPPLKYYDFPLSPGKTWQQTTTETDIKTGKTRIHTITGTVSQWENVTVPAGTFYAIRVNLGTDVFNPSTGERINGTDTSWYVPDVHRSVKSMTTGKDGKQQLIQLIQYELK